MLKSRNWQNKDFHRHGCDRWIIKKERRTNPIVLCLFAVVLIPFIYLLTNYLGVTTEQISYDSNSIRRVVKKEGDDTGIRLQEHLPSEGIFLKALKDCKNNAPTSIGRCFVNSPKNDKKEKNKTKQQQQQQQQRKKRRIAIFSPPGSESANILFRSLRDNMIRYRYGGDKMKMDSALELVHTSHVPPYGYGGNHGWTRMVRLISSPLLVQVHEAVRYAITGEGDVVDGIDDGDLLDSSSSQLRKLLLQGGDSGSTDGIFSVALAQIIRWHCRLSHVAAHTPLLNVLQSFDGGDEDGDSPGTDTRNGSGGNMYTASGDGIINIKSITILVEFILSGDDNDDFLSSSSAEIIDSIADSIRKDLTKANTPQQQQQQQQKEQHSEIDKLLLLPSVSDFYGVMERVLVNELRSTKNLSAWPCLSFWDFDNLPPGNDGGKSPSILVRDASRRTAKELVPDCDSTFVKCTINKDLCEVKGDAICRK